MKEWTRDERYRVLESPEQIRELHEKTKQSVYRQTYHVQPVTGLSSDPNGFALHKGVWHLFYQWCPWGAVHGLKYWYHVSSEDLMHWKNEGTGLKPDRDYDNKGNHSGSAISDGSDLYFFYTGNHRDEDWVRTPYTCAAWLGEDGKPVKLDAPLFGPHPGYSEHQRDPKIVYHEEKKKYYIFIGAQTLDQKGTVLVYESEKLLEGWRFAGQLKVPGYESFGGMWECPYIVNISGHDLLIFSPQYTTLPGRGESTNHNVYLIGSMDYDNLVFTPQSDYKFLDYGFDFYAAQGAANVGDPDKAILIAWIGLPDNHYPTAEEEGDWEGSMTLPRELRIADGRLWQTPVETVKELREGEAVFGNKGKLFAACEIEAEADPSADLDLNLFTREDGTGGMRLHYDAAEKTCTIDRSGMDLRFNEHVGEKLRFSLEDGLRQIRIFADHCSVEYFFNEGEATFTSHCYPTAGEFFYEASETARLTIWKLGSSVKDDFVV